jgi:hypothetical protein
MYVNLLCTFSQPDICPITSGFVDPSTSQALFPYCPCIRPVNAPCEDFDLGCPCLLPCPPQDALNMNSGNGSVDDVEVQAEVA